ncbi:hypothetical protein diail_7542 [Diaporthe ilicicola]|nr:hypothetical protein diail_7542 [Diaporthe ilicicola]
MGQFDWFSKIGATPQAVAVLNDQPYLFTILIVVLVILILQGVFIWYIHFATLKPEQKKKKEPKGGKGGAKKRRKGLVATAIAPRNVVEEELYSILRLA